MGGSVLCSYPDDDGEKKYFFTGNTAVVRRTAAGYQVKTSKLNDSATNGWVPFSDAELLFEKICPGILTTMDGKKGGNADTVTQDGITTTIFPVTNKNEPFAMLALDVGGTAGWGDAEHVPIEDVVSRLGLAWIRTAGEPEILPGKQIKEVYFIGPDSEAFWGVNINNDTMTGGDEAVGIVMARIGAQYLRHTKPPTRAD